jgi:hypothetical protein
MAGLLRLEAKATPRVPRTSKLTIGVGSGTVIIVAKKRIGNSLSSSPKFSKPGTIGGAEKTSK